MTLILHYYWNCKAISRNVDKSWFDKTKHTYCWKKKNNNNNIAILKKNCFLTYKIESIFNK